MIEKKDLFGILNKYGLDSKYFNLYVYEDGGRFGFLYSFSHPFYGVLQRVIFFNSLEKAEDFVYCYWWFKKYQKKFDITLELDNYEKLNPRPMFFMYGRELNSKDMKLLLTDPEELPREKKRQRVYERCIRTARILVAIMEEKIKIQNDTYHNVTDLDLEFQKQENEFLKLHSAYFKEQKPLNDIQAPVFEDISKQKELQKLNQQIDYFMDQKDMKTLKEFIDSLWKSLLKMETDKGHLQNKYLLFKLPIDLDDVQKKKNYMLEVSKKKKGLFSKKAPVELELRKIEAESEIHKVIHMKDFISNETKRLQEKYAIIEEMDYATLGDYLNEFDNLGISSPLELLDKPQNRRYTKEEIQKEFQSIYESLSESDRQCLAIYHSFMQPICDYILFGIINLVDKSIVLKETKANYLAEIQQSMLILADADNVMMRMKKMKLLSLRSENTFLESLYQVCMRLRSLQNFQISGVYYGFGKSMQQEYLDAYHATLKNIGVPIQTKNKYDIHDILEIKAHVSALYFPYSYSVKDYVFHDYTIEEQKKEEILLFLKDYQVNLSNSDIIKVSRFQGSLKQDEMGQWMCDMNLIKSDLYRHITISK